mmetsp:Transcript_52981/g.160973  ORF Transcript_52981/g.160973 Transcript_52981/m.160973 type:complete len:219 (-) Transcript_52981:15-671(-)
MSMLSATTWSPSISIAMSVSCMLSIDRKCEGVSTLGPTSPSFGVATRNVFPTDDGHWSCVYCWWSRAIAPPGTQSLAGSTSDSCRAMPPLKPMKITRDAPANLTGWVPTTRPTAPKPSSMQDSTASCFQEARPLMTPATTTTIAVIVRTLTVSKLAEASAFGPDQKLSYAAGSRVTLLVATWKGARASRAGTRPPNRLMLGDCPDGRASRRTQTVLNA